MFRVKALSYLLLAALSLAACGKEDQARNQQMTLSEAQANIASGRHLSEIPKSVWRQILPKAQYDVLWESATERPNSGKWLHNKAEGVYVSAGCRLPVFSSKQKYDSGTGWPSFWKVAFPENVVLKEDYSWGMKRTEVLSSCGEHLGHLFKDGPAPTRLRYCLNSLALDFIPAGAKSN